jgi:hypothetical protein
MACPFKNSPASGYALGQALRKSVADETDEKQGSFACASLTTSCRVNSLEQF